MILPTSIVEDLEKIGRDCTVWQLADTGNSAPSKVLYEFCWLLESYMCRLMVTMFLSEMSCKINSFQEDTLVTTFYQKILTLLSVLKETANDNVVRAWCLWIDEIMLRHIKKM